MVKLPLFHRTCRLPDRPVAHIQRIMRRLQRATVWRMFSIVCVFVFVVAVILFFFAHQSGEDDVNFLSHLPVDKSGVRPLCDSKDSRFLTQHTSSLDILLGTHL